MNLAAVYARYSSDKQNETSSQAQIRAAEAYCAAKNYTVVKIYTDEAKSAKTDDRPAFQQMITDAKNKLFNILIVHKIDRFSRNRYDSAIYKRALQKANVTIEYVEQYIDGSPESVIMESLLEGMAEYYSLNLAKETMKGLNERAYSAKFNGGTPPLGYDIVNEQYVINERESNAVQMIFKMFIDGHGYGKISDELTRLGYRTKRGNPFGKNSLHEILKNQKYIGRYTFGKVKKQKNGKRNSHAINDDAVIVENALPVIINKIQFEKVKTIMEKNKKRPGSFRAKEIYLLSGKIFCGECNAAMIGKTSTVRQTYRYSRYVCGSQDRHLGTCHNSVIQRDTIESHVANYIEKSLFSPLAIAELTQKINSSMRAKASNVLKEFDLLTLEEKSVIKKISNLYETIEDGEADDFDKSRLNKNKSRANQIHSRLIELHQMMESQYLSEEQISITLESYKNMAKEKTPESLQMLFNTFLDRVIINNDDFEVILKVCVGLIGAEDRN